MTLEEQNKINEESDKHGFCCTKCKAEIRPSDCHGCPIYGWSFSDDENMDF